MTAPALRVLETITSRSALAVRGIDAATGATITGGLEATAWPEAHPGVVTAAAPATGAGILGFRGLPGLRPYEDGSADREQYLEVPRSRPLVPFIVRVVDRLERYLPVVRRVLVPSATPVVVPLPPGPAATAPAGHGLVVGLLLRESDREPATWALVEVALGATRVSGVTDRRGAFAVPVPLVGPPINPPPGDVPTWSVAVSVRYRVADQLRAPGTGDDDPPTLDSIAAQTAADVVDRNVVVAAVTRSLTRSTALVVSSDWHPPPSSLLVRPAP